MSIFGKKQQITRSQFREALRGTPDSKLKRRERVSLEKEAYPRKIFGPLISKKDFKRGIKKLKGERFKAKTGVEKRKISRWIRLLEKKKKTEGF